MHAWSRRLPWTRMQPGPSYLWMTSGIWIHGSSLWYTNHRVFCSTNADCISQTRFRLIFPLTVIFLQMFQRAKVVMVTRVPIFLNTSPRLDFRFETVRCLLKLCQYHWSSTILASLLTPCLKETIFFLLLTWYGRSLLLSWFCCSRRWVYTKDQMEVDMVLLDPTQIWLEPGLAAH
jgi:hypothetical protein